MTQALPPRVQPESLSVLEVVSVVVRQRRLLLTSAFVGALLGGLGAFFSPVMYTAEVSFLTRNTEQAGLASVGGLAQQFGFSLPGSTGAARSPEFYRNLLRSRQILEGVVESGFELVTPTGIMIIDLAANRSEEAAKHYEAAINVRPRFMDIRTKFAESLIDRGELERAKTELLVILESRPAFVGARIRLGVVLQRTGDTEGAICEWNRCAVDDPADMRPRAYLASVGVTLSGEQSDRDGGASTDD